MSVESLISADERALGLPGRRQLLCLGVYTDLEELFLHLEPFRKLLVGRSRPNFFDLLDRTRLTGCFLRLLCRQLTLLHLLPPIFNLT